MSGIPDWVRIQAAMMRGIFRSQRGGTSGPEITKALCRDELEKAGLGVTDDRFEHSYMVATTYYQYVGWRNRLPEEDALFTYIKRTIPVLGEPQTHVWV